MNWGEWGYIYVETLEGNLGVPGRSRGSDESAYICERER